MRNLVVKSVSFILFLTLQYMFSANSALATSSLASDITLATHVTGSGTLEVTPNSPAYPHSQEILLSANPALGWRIEAWSGDLNHSAPWWHTYWSYRTTLLIDVNDITRQDKIVEVAINFTELLNGVEESNAFDSESIRVVEIAADGDILDANVPFQFDKDLTYSAADRASGNLIILMKGVTSGQSNRLYHVYFAPAGDPYFPPAFSPLIRPTYSGVTDEGHDSYKFETDRATYFFHEQGGGFSSIVDNEGNDWISYNSTSGSGGTYRGIPNLIYRGPNQSGGFHPGLDNATTTRLHSGPLKVTFRTVDNNWEALWEIYPDSIRMSLLQAEHNYWFLYEGTPGGSLDSNDYFVVSDGNVYDAYSDTDNENDFDIPGDEWLYFADPDIGTSGRALYLVHHESDSYTDSYRRLGSGSSAMTVFGFGRSDLETQLILTPQRFTVGLIDEIDFAGAQSLIEAAYKDVDVSILNPESVSSTEPVNPGTSSSFTLPMNMSRIISVTFVPEYYTINSFTIGEGMLELSEPANSTGYIYGERVTLTATAFPGWRFSGWDGLVSNSTSTQVVTITSTNSLTATFSQISYSVTLDESFGGSVTVVPAKAAYTYGETVQISATATPGYRFVRWAGDLNAENLTETLTITGDINISADFEQVRHSVGFDVQGEGTIRRQPEQPTYAAGDVVQLVAVPQKGWHFYEWKGLLSGTNPTQNLTIWHSETVTATFVQNEYEVSTNIVGEGSVSPNPDRAQYLLNSEVTLSAFPDEHWQFDGWRDETGKYHPENNFTIAITQDRILTATFSPVLYGIDLRRVGNGHSQVSAPANSVNYEFGEEVVLTAVPDPGWMFSHWTVAGRSGEIVISNLISTIRVDGSMEITAHFEQRGNSHIIEVVGNGQVLIDPISTNYANGQSITLTAQPDPGWRFVGWSEPKLGSDPVVNIVIKPDHKISALFEKEEYTVGITIIGNGRVEQSPRASKYSFEEVIELAVQPSDGWFFNGWQGGLTGTFPTASLTVTQSTVITATFSRIPYELATTVLGGGRIEVHLNGAVVDEFIQAEKLSGEMVLLQAVPEPGWTFVRWLGDLSGSNQSELILIDRNKSVTALFADENSNLEGQSQITLYLPLIR